MVADDSCLVLEKLSAPELAQALDLAMTRQLEHNKCQPRQLLTLIGNWYFDASHQGFLLDYQCAQLFGLEDYHRWYTIEEISDLLPPIYAQKLIYNFIDPHSGEIMLEKITTVQGPYQGCTLVVQASVLFRDHVTGKVLLAAGTVTYEHSSHANFLVRELTGDGIFVLNGKEDYMICSSSYHAMLGYGKGEFPQAFSVFSEVIVHPDDLDTLEIQRHIIDSPHYGDSWACCLRLRHKNGHYLWTLGRGLVLKRDEQGKAEIIVGSRSNIDLVHKNFDDINQLLFNDSLTSLYNRSYFEQNSVRFMEESVQPVSVIFVDVSGLKLTNDILGHAYGDYLLLKTTELLVQELLGFMQEVVSCKSNSGEQAAQSEQNQGQGQEQGQGQKPENKNLSQCSPCMRAFTYRMHMLLDSVKTKARGMLTANGAFLPDDDSGAVKAQAMSAAEALLAQEQCSIAKAVAQNQSVSYQSDGTHANVDDPLLYALIETALQGQQREGLGELSAQGAQHIHDVSTYLQSDFLLDDMTAAQRSTVASMMAKIAAHAQEEPREADIVLETINARPFCQDEQAAASLVSSAALKATTKAAIKVAQQLKKKQQNKYGQAQINDPIEMDGAMLEKQQLELIRQEQQERLQQQSMTQSSDLSEITHASVNLETPEVIRLAGDEFIVVLPNCPVTQVQALEQRIRAANNRCNASYEKQPIEKRPVPLCFGIGSATVGEGAPVGVVTPQGPDTFLWALERADERMQQDKECHHSEHLGLLKRFFERKLKRQVSLRDERRAVLLTKAERDLLQSN